MKHTRSLLVVAALAGLVAACGESGEPRGAASSRSAGQDPTEGPRYADADRNGRVTRDEASIDPALAASFDRYDANANGELDRGEFARLEAGATSGSKATPEDEERHTLRPRNEYPRPYD